MVTKFTNCIGVIAILTLSGCSSLSNVFNPFYEPPSDLAFQGERNDKALSGQEEKIDTARQALESMASYQRGNMPEPVKPVVQPAVYRLMWVPDHLNRHGDLVPAHYYYLKVLSDRPAVTDAFELEAQLNGPGAMPSDVSNVPFVTEPQEKR